MTISNTDQAYSMVQVVPNTFGVLILGRLMTGVGFGVNYITTNLYVAECAPKLLRGSFIGTVSQFGYQLGTVGLTVISKPRIVHSKLTWHS